MGLFNHFQLRYQYVMYLEQNLIHRYIQQCSVYPENVCVRFTVDFKVASWQVPDCSHVKRNPNLNPDQSDKPHQRLKPFRGFADDNT
jgi:hypothetical protein